MLRSSPEPSSSFGSWKDFEPMRSGVIAQKVGMTRVYNDAGEHVPVTVLRVGRPPGRSPAHSSRKRTATPRSAWCWYSMKVKNTSMAMRGTAIANVEPKAKLAEFRVTEDNLLDVGTGACQGCHFCYRSASSMSPARRLRVLAGAEEASIRLRRSAPRTVCRFRTARTV